MFNKLISGIIIILFIGSCIIICEELFLKFNNLSSDKNFKENIVKTKREIYGGINLSFNLDKVVGLIIFFILILVLINKNSNVQGA